jgi:hypothetical protein
VTERGGERVREREKERREREKGRESKRDGEKEQIISKKSYQFNIMLSLPAIMSMQSIGRKS